jgi:hypothetical protein
MLIILNRTSNTDLNIKHMTRDECRFTLLRLTRIFPMAKHLYIYTVFLVDSGVQF